MAACLESGLRLRLCGHGLLNDATGSDRGLYRRCLGVLGAAVLGLRRLATAHRPNSSSAICPARRLPPPSPQLLRWRLACCSHWLPGAGISPITAAIAGAALAATYLLVLRRAFSATHGKTSPALPNACCPAPHRQSRASRRRPSLTRRPLPSKRLTLLQGRAIRPTAAVRSTDGSSSTAPGDRCARAPKRAAARGWRAVQRGAWRAVHSAGGRRRSAARACSRCRKRLDLQHLEALPLR